MRFGAELYKLRDMVPAAVRRRSVLLFVLFTLSAALDSFGLVLIFAFFELIVDPTSAVPGPLDWLRRVSPAGESQITLLILALSLIGVFAVKTMTQILATYLRLHVELKTRTTLAIETLGGYLAAPYSLHLRRNLNELIRNAHTCVGHCSQSVVNIADLASDLLLLATIGATMLVLQPAATIAVAVGFAMLGLLYMRLGQTHFRDWGQSSNAANEEMYRTAVEALSGVKQVKALGAGPYFAALYERFLGRFGAINLKNALVQQSLKPVLEFFLVVTLLAPVIVLLASDRSPAAIVGVLAMFGVAAYRLMPSVVRIATSLQMLRFSAASISVIHADLTSFRASQFAEDGATPGPRFESEIRFNDVGLRYEGREMDALAGVTLTIQRGESIGLVGASGAGKTTLVDLMLGLLTPTCGTIAIDGAIVSNGSGPQPHLFSYVPQDAFLVNDTIRRNVALGVSDATIDESRLQHAIETASLREFIVGLPNGLDTVVGDRGVRLSGGQRQRLAIARALYRDPEILVLDEATSSLDPVTEAEVAGAIERLRGRKTLVIVAHRLSTVKNCDRLFLLDGGRLADSGGFAELYTRNTLFREMVRHMEMPNVDPASSRAAVA